MKPLRIFAHRSEAHLAKSLLASHGIRAEIMAEEAQTHGAYTLVVSEPDWQEGRKIIDEVLAKDMMLVKPAGRPDHFKKAVLFALGAPLIFPVVFNYRSFFHAWKYWENSRKEMPDRLKLAFIVALNIPTYFVLKYVFTMVGDLTSVMGLSDEGAEF